MRLVAPPTHVGEDQWPVLSAVRVNTADDPAEFVVLVDCGEGTPVHRYATLRVFVWTTQRTRRKIGDGEYKLTFEQARRSLAERASTVASTRWSPWQAPRYGCARTAGGEQVVLAGYLMATPEFR
jgi:hypothetical protein